MCYYTIILAISLLLLINIPYYYINNTCCGIFVVDYSYCVYINIGDYIQSIAAMQFCKGIKIKYVERDSIMQYKGKKVKIIMNAWWKINKMNIIPSKKILPLYISYHLDNPENITINYIKYLKKHEPIGYRDISTKKTLSNLGIKSYFSGCLTLTLGKTYKNKHFQSKKIIYFIDCRLCYKYKQFILDYIMNITNLSNYTIVNLRHEYSKKLSHKKRFNLADNILRKYESAYLVLTSRLHACLPCVAMNTSVMLIRNNLDKRFSGLINFTNYIIFNNTNPYIRVTHKNRNIINPNNYRNYELKLEKTVKDFLLYK